jgi:hypothetical protein
VYNANEVKELTKPIRHPKGWTALFSDESEWIEYCKWRKMEQPISSVVSEKKVQALADELNISEGWTYLSKCKRIHDKDYGDCFPAELVYNALKITSKQSYKAAPNHLDELEKWIDTKIIQYPNGQVELAYNSTLEEVSKQIQSLKQ